MRRDVQRTAFRVAAVFMLLFAALGWTAALLDFARGKQHGFPELLRLLSDQRPWLYLSLLGGMAYVLPGINLARNKTALVDQRGPFDFQQTFGPYIVQETTGGLLLRWALGCLCFVLFLILGMASRLGFDRGPYFPFMYVVGVVAAPPSIMMLIVTLRVFARRAESVLRRNRRRPILYLRSFAADVGVFTGVLDFLRMLVLPGLRDSPEASLRRALRNVGPLVAVGRPGEWLRSLGAARLYVRDDWQSVVAKLAEESELVIFRLGRTEGFWWEVQHALRKCDPRRVLIYLPNADRGKIYRSFRERSVALFPHPLPARLGQAQFIAFDSHWQPRLLGSQRTSTGATLRWVLGSRAAGVREALNETLPLLGLNSRPLPWGFRERLALVVFVIALFSCLCGLPTQLLFGEYQRQKNNHLRKVDEVPDRGRR